MRDGKLSLVTLAEKIMGVIQSRGMSLRQVSDASGIPYNTLRAYTKKYSKAVPTAPNGIALAKALGVDVYWLFDEEREMPVVPYHSPPPVKMNPWPPDGIGWADIRYLLHRYNDAKAFEDILKWADQLEKDKDYLSYLGKDELRHVIVTTERLHEDPQRCKSYPCLNRLSEAEEVEVMARFRAGVDNLKSHWRKIEP